LPIQDILIALIAVPMCIAWCYMYLAAPLRVRKVKRLADESPKPPARWPKLSVIVPACNEAATLEAAVASLRAQTYPNLELVVVDDRSTDGTGEIVDRIAAQDPRVLAIHVKELPAGWLGKVHALHQATRAATGELLLYTDADIHFLPGVLEKAVAFMVESELDHLTLLPDLKPRGFVLQTVEAAFGSTLFTMGSPHRIGEPGSKSFVGVGAFNLVRRTAFDRTEGFEWLKMEPGDDFGLALLLHRAGARAAFRRGLDELAVEWYSTTGEMIRGLEKNTFGPLCGYSYLRLFAIVALSLALMIGPVLAITSGSKVIVAFGVLALLSLPIGLLGIKKKMKLKALPLLAAPLGNAILIYTLVRAAVLCGLQGGIRWRGTLYPVEELRRARRVDLSSGRVRPS
jgi:glycosyltransferase involved in cell wall biosynthesis